MKWLLFIFLVLFIQEEPKEKNYQFKKLEKQNSKLDSMIVAKQLADSLKLDSLKIKEK